MRFAVCLVLMLAIVYARNRKDDIFCTVCKKLVDKIAPFVNNTDVESIADGICDDLTFGNQALDQICQNFVDDSIGGICDDIKQGKDDTTICKDLKAC